MLAFQAEQIGEVNNRAELSSQAEGFDSVVSIVSCSILNNTGQFIFLRNVGTAQITGEELILEGGGVRCVSPLLFRLYAYPFEMNGTRAFDTGALREWLNVTCGSDGREYSALSKDCWELFSNLLETNALRLAITPFDLDVLRSVKIEKVGMAHLYEGEVVEDAFLFIYQ